MSLGQTVNPVVDNNVCHIDVSSQGMDEMTKPYRIGISISTDSNDRKLGVGELHTLRNRKSSSVKRMKSVRVKIAVQSTMTSNPGNNAHFFRLDFKRKGHFLKCRKKAVEAAATAPGGILMMIVF